MGAIDTKDASKWDKGRKLDLVVMIVRGKLSVDEASRIHQISAHEINQWIEEAVQVIEAALGSYPRIVLDLYEKRIAALQLEYIDAVQKRDAFKEYYRRLSNSN